MVAGKALAIEAKVFCPGRSRPTCTRHRRLDADRHVRDHERHRLVVRDRHAHRLALGRRDRLVIGAPARPWRRRRRAGGWSKAPIATLNPPSAPSRFLSDTTTSSKVMPRVSNAAAEVDLLAADGDARRVGLEDEGGEARAGALGGSVFASTKYQFATPPFVIHILLPLSAVVAF